MQLGVAVEQVGQVEGLELLDADRTELGQRGREQLHGAELHGLELLLVLVQRRVGVDLDLDLALGEFAGALGEELGGLALGRVVGDDMAELEDDRALRPRDDVRQRREGGGSGEDQGAAGDAHAGLLGKGVDRAAGGRRAVIVCPGGARRHL